MNVVYFMRVILTMQRSPMFERSFRCCGLLDVLSAQPHAISGECLKVRDVGSLFGGFSAVDAAEACM